MAQACETFERAVELITRRWTPLIIQQLDGAPRRFNALAAAIPAISDRLLAVRLSELEEEGIVARCDEGYSLTEKGAALRPVLEALGKWASDWVPVSARARSRETPVRSRSRAASRARGRRP